MDAEDLLLGFSLGRPVHRSDDTTGRVGYVVAVILATPCTALVRWRNETPSFEPLDMLVEVVQRLL